MPNLGELEKIPWHYATCYPGFEINFFLKGSTGDARPLILVKINQLYALYLLHDKKNKSKQILNNVTSFQAWKAVVCFIVISLVIQNADRWDRNHSLVFITSEIRVLYCSLHIFALNFWLQSWPVNCNFRALLLQPDLVSNGECPKQAAITLSLEDFTINIGNGDQTTPGRAQKWLFWFSFLQKLPVEKGLCIFSVLTPPPKQGHRQISYIRIAEHQWDLTNRAMAWALLSEKYIERRHVHLLLRVQKQWPFVFKYRQGAFS